MLWRPILCWRFSLQLTAAAKACQFLHAACLPSLRFLAGFSFLQSSVDFLDCDHGGRMLALFDAVQCFRSDSGAAGQVHLSQSQLATGAKDIAADDYSQGLQ